MSTHSTETSGEEDASSRPRASGTVSTIEKRGRDGSIAMLVGSAMLAWALATIRKSKGRATLLALLCLGLFGIGVEQRRTGRSEDGVETGEDVRRDEEGDKKVSDESHVERDRDLGAGRNADESASVSQSETEPNPRGVSDRSDVRTDDGGDIDFVEGKEPGTHRETHLEDENAHDPRLHPESDDERTEVDLSKAAMADEASEAAGPHPEQAYPAFEGTDPEPTADEAPERVGEGAVAPARSNSEDRRAGDETRDGDNGSAETIDEPDPTEAEREASDDATETESGDGTDDA